MSVVTGSDKHVNDDDLADLGERPDLTDEALMAILRRDDRHILDALEKATREGLRRRNKRQ